MFRENEFVFVKSEEEILSTLKDGNDLAQKLFSKQLLKHCQKKYKVDKVVKNVFDEKQKKTMKLKEPLFILKGVNCDGKVDDFDKTCDHHCFLLWHKLWLAKK